ncbi:MAG: hypothetical protein OEY49_07535 [Candidatus Heimdallarchaeota archaeon]|nr:hypothetical protein [Candidatus Heimdallarchaeota archaeon]
MKSVSTFPRLKSLFSKPVYLSYGTVSALPFASLFLSSQTYRIIFLV